MREWPRERAVTLRAHLFSPSIVRLNRYIYMTQMESTRSERSRRKQTKIADSEWRVRVFHWWNEWMKRWRMAGFCQRADRLRRYLLAMTWLYYQERFLRPAAEDDAFAMDSSFGRPGTWQPLRINKFQPAAPCRNPSRLIFLLPPFLFSSFSRPSFSLSFPAFDPGEPAGILFISQQLCRHITWECTRSDFIYIPQCSVCQQRPKCIKKIWDGRRRSGGLNEATGRKWKRSMARLSWGEWKRDEEKTWCVRERERWREKESCPSQREHQLTDRKASERRDSEAKVPTLPRVYIFFPMHSYWLRLNLIFRRGSAHHHSGRTKNFYFNFSILRGIVLLLLCPEERTERARVFSKAAHIRRIRPAQKGVATQSRNIYMTAQQRQSLTTN